MDPDAEWRPHEADVTTDYNAEMIEQRARFQRVRDRSIFVGDPDDIVPESFGPGLPDIREWTEQNFEFGGYITGFDPIGPADRDALRDELGYRDDERVCIVSVGGSGVGASLLRRVADAAQASRRLVDGLRFVVVAGPRIDIATLPTCDGVTYQRYVPDLYRHLAACDLAVVQGGLTTCMELTANQRPFVYIPLRNHFEQNFHVRHRLERYGAGRYMSYDDASDPDALATAIALEIDRTSTTARSTRTARHAPRPASPTCSDAAACALVDAFAARLGIEWWRVRPARTMPQVGLVADLQETPSGPATRQVFSRGLRRPRGPSRRRWPAAGHRRPTRRS